MGDNGGAPDGQILMGEGEERERERGRERK